MRASLQSNLKHIMHDIAVPKIASAKAENVSVDNPLSVYMSSANIVVSMPTALFLLSNHPIFLYIISSKSLVLKFLIKFSDPYANDSF